MTTPFGIYNYNRLVMRAHPASGECQSRMAVIMRGLEGEMQIKDDIVVHRKDEQHDDRLRVMQDRKIKVYVDHGPEGLASTIAQGYTNDEDPRDGNIQWRPMNHTSHALTKAERAYGKMDGESMGVYSGIITNRR